MILKNHLALVKVVSSRYFIEMQSSATSVAVLLERLARLIVNDGHARGLRPAQWEALRYLARANRFSRAPSAVTSYLGSTKGTVSQTLNALERKGWVRKQRVEADKRSIRLALTDEGRALLEEDPLALTVDAVAGLDDEGVPAQLAAGLREILNQRLAANGGVPFGLCRTCRFFERDSPDGAPHRCGLLRAPLSLADAELICVEQEALEP